MRVCGDIVSQMHTGVKVRVRERDLNLPPSLMRLPWCLSGKGSACQYRRLRFDPWVRKIRWRRRWQPTPGFLPGKSRRQRSLVGYSPWGCKESDTTERLNNKPSLHPLWLGSIVCVNCLWTPRFGIWRGVAPAALPSFLLQVSSPSSFRGHFWKPSFSGFLFSLDKIDLLCLCWAWRGWGWVIKGSLGYLFPLIYIPAVRARITHYQGRGGWWGASVMSCRSPVEECLTRLTPSRAGFN